MKTRICLGLTVGLVLFLLGGLILNQRGEAQYQEVVSSGPVWGGDNIQSSDGQLEAIIEKTRQEAVTSAGLIFPYVYTTNYDQEPLFWAATIETSDYLAIPSSGLITNASVVTGYNGGNPVIEQATVFLYFFRNIIGVYPNQEYKNYSYVIARFDDGAMKVIAWTYDKESQQTLIDDSFYRISGVAFDGTDIYLARNKVWNNGSFKETLTGMVKLTPKQNP